MLLLVPVAAGAQESPKESGEIRNGTAKATALVSRIGPGVGALELAVRAGTAVTQLRNDLAQSTSQVLDLGLIGTSLTAEGCSAAVLTADQLPQATSVDNRGGEAQQSRDEAQTTGSPIGIGRMQVSAAKEPVKSSAAATAGIVELAPGVGVSAGQATARTEVLPGEGREAEAIVDTASLNLGPVSLGGMRWRAYHRTGVDPLAQATFEVGRASVGGVPIPTDDLQTLEEGINTVLGPLGASIHFPTVERFLEPADLIRITPLRVEFRDTEVGKTLLGPVLDATRDQRGDLFDTLSSQLCQLSSVLLIGDVVLSILSGTGFLTVDLGGAEALSSDFEFIDPFGGLVTPPPVVEPAPPAPVTSDLSAPVSTGATSPPANAVAPPAADEQATRAVPASTSSGPLEKFCESIHPNRGGCKEGAALALGMLGLLATLGVGGAEVVRHRRRGTEVGS